jgi:PAS domain S-box-containing protein
MTEICETSLPTDDVLVEVAPIGVLVLDSALRVLRFNPYFESLLGYTQAELVGSDWLEGCVLERARVRFRDCFEDSLEGGVTVTCAGPVRTRTGIEKRLECRARPVPDGEGRAAGLLVIAREVPQGIDLPADLRENEKRVRRALQNAEMQRYALDQHSIVAVTDASGKITYVNDRFCRISRYSREELLGKDHRIINSGYHSKEYFRDMWRTISRGEVWRGEIRNRAKDGSNYWVDTTIVPFKDETDRITQYVAIRTDITDRKRMQQQLIQSAKFAALGELAANIAHEVNNPIGIISGKARLLVSRAAPKFPEKMIRDLGKIVEQCDRLSDLTRRLLEYCRPTMSAKVPIDPHRPLQRAMDLASHRAKTLGVEVKTTLERNEARVRGNGNELEQVFLNILINAIDSMPGGGRVTISSRTEGVAVDGERSGIRVAIEDTGVGIDESIAHRIFDPFFTTKGEGKGTGLGLSISYSIVRSHGGFIDFESKPGQGTRFTVTLPLVEPSPQE